jgi:uncharacterized membrane protein required for colicin V production
MRIDTLGFNSFDLVALAAITVGIFRGRSRGMSEELLDVLKWLAIVVLGGLLYQPGGALLAQYTPLSGSPAFVVVYIGIVIFIRFFFSWIKHLVGEKLVGGDVFGDLEYYLGMCAGAVRFACYLLVGMALLNARYISPEELAANARMQQENFGDISFPTIGSIQQTVFKGSASGQLVKHYLGHELITATPADKSAGSGETLGRQRERAVSEVLGEKTVTR